jgi:uncharacterized protein (TIGR02118 family)
MSGNICRCGAYPRIRVTNQRSMSMAIHHFISPVPQATPESSSRRRFLKASGLVAGGLMVGLGSAESASVANNSVKNHMLKVDTLMRRRPDLTHDQFTAYWRDVHAQLFSSQPVVKQYVRRYVQSRTIANPPRSVALADFDGIAQMWFDDMDGFHGVFSSQNYRDVIRVDLQKFTDGTRSEFLFSEETSIIG